MIDDRQRFTRVLAWLMRNEGVSAEAVQRAVVSASDMTVGDNTVLADPDFALRRAFLNEQIGRLTR